MRIAFFCIFDIFSMLLFDVELAIVVQKYTQKSYFHRTENFGDLSFFNRNLIFVE